MNDPKKDMIEHMKQLLNENKIKFPDESFIVSPADRPKFETGQFRKSLFPERTPNIIESTRIEPGYAVYLERPSYRLDLKPIPRDFGFQELSDHIVDAIGRALAIPSRFFDKPYRWQRWSHESVFEWGERLSARGLLDNPEIRWEYQKAVFKGIGLKLLKLITPR